MFTQESFWSGSDSSSGLKYFNNAMCYLPPSRRGRPLLWDGQTDKEVQMYLLSLCEAGGGVNCAIAKASATEIIR